MSGDELHTFLRFVTGSLVISVPNIDVIFNSLNGLGRQPVSHTSKRVFFTRTRSTTSFLCFIGVETSTYNWTYFCKLTVNVFHLRNYFLGLVLVRVFYLVSVQYVA